MPTELPEPSEPNYCEPPTGYFVRQVTYQPGKSPLIVNIPCAAEYQSVGLFTRLVAAHHAQWGF